MPIARRQVRLKLWLHAGARDVLDDAELLVSELVTNAVLHANARPWQPVRVLLWRAGAALRVEVHDPDPTPPVLMSATEGDESGRGLLLVDTLADAWGVQARPDGKSVWFELAQAWPS
ncbi:MAG: ATP-binding protein [Streptomycetales bacterium]